MRVRYIKDPFLNILHVEPSNEDGNWIKETGPAEQEQVQEKFLFEFY